MTVTVPALPTTPFGEFSTADEVAEGIDLTGRRAVVTGASSGIGVETARTLASHGAGVTLAVRDTTAGERVAADIRAGAPHARVDVRALELGERGSIAAFVDAWEGPLDLLVNNAGVMAIPRRETVDGFEMQLGTNHLGHFALTGLLLPLLIDVRGARVVTVSSNAHKPGKITFDDLQRERYYSRWSAYMQSKL
ncbi:MAG: hypothetical protein QOE59_806, partial [Actinomycetota bacterium]|nr:hypothetical protein [Actinomycetota bacterium]